MTTHAIHTLVNALEEDPRNASATPMIIGAALLEVRDAIVASNRAARDGTWPIRDAAVLDAARAYVAARAASLSSNDADTLAALIAATDALVAAVGAS